MNKQKNSYKQIVKSTSIFGGVQVVNILLGFVRQKALAVLLGPAGVGLISVYQSIIDLIKSVSSLGVDTAGIKDIASAADDKEVQYQKISVFRFWILLTSSFGALLCLLFSYPISFFVFKDTGYALHIAVLSVCIFFTIFSTGQCIIMQATRNIALMAKAVLLSNIVGLIVSLILYYYLGIKGIIPAFITGSVIFLLFGAFYLRKLKIPKVHAEVSESFRQGISILKLGTFIVIASVMETCSTFIIRAFLMDRLGKSVGLEAIGYLQPAWTITIMYLSLILKSMGTDFFPRLCSLSDNNSQMRKLVNEQTFIAMLIATPVIVFMLVYPEYVLTLLYDSRFLSGSVFLQWHIGGGFFKVLAWPLAFMLLAKGKGKQYLIIEVVYFVTYLGCSYLLFPYFEVLSIGISYLISYVVYLAVLYAYTSRTNNFRWNRSNIRTGIVCLFFMSVSIFLALYGGYIKLLAGLVVFMISVGYSLYMFNRIYPLKDLWKEIKRKILSKK